MLEKMQTCPVLVFIYQKIKLSPKNLGFEHLRTQEKTGFGFRVGYRNSATNLYLVLFLC